MKQVFEALEISQKIILACGQNLEKCFPYMNNSADGSRFKETGR